MISRDLLGPQVIRSAAEYERDVASGVRYRKLLIWAEGVAVGAIAGGAAVFIVLLFAHVHP